MLCPLQIGIMVRYLRKAPSQAGCFSSGSSRGRYSRPQTAGIARPIDRRKDHLVIVFSVLQFVSARMPRAVQMRDTVQVVDHVGDDVSLHDLLMIDVVDELDQRVVHFPNDFKTFHRRPEIISGMVKQGVQWLDHDGHAGFFQVRRRGRAELPQCSCAALLWEPLCRGQPA